MGNNIYETLGSYFTNDKYLSEKINPYLYNTAVIDVEILVLDLPISEKGYKISNIRISKDQLRNSDLSKIVEEVQKKLNNQEDTFDSWKVFYLLKELITGLEAIGFNYFRGQQKGWETVPSIFRHTENSNHEPYYLKFEEIYQEVSREFPNDIKYYEYPEDNNLETIEKRAVQLGILQHYGIPTSLLDITGNPFIALLFMFGIGTEIDHPQFQAYKIDDISLEEKGLISVVDKLSVNRRIQAQKGSFINYDKLNRFVVRKYQELEIKDNYKKIDRVIISLNIDIDKSKKYLQSELEAAQENIKIIQKAIKNELSVDDLAGRKIVFDVVRFVERLENFDNFSLEEISGTIQDAFRDEIVSFDFPNRNADLDDRNIKGVIATLGKEETLPKIMKEVYRFIQSEVLNKLKEYKYEEKDLYPDFIDFLKFVSKDFSPIQQEIKRQEINDFSLDKLS